jgi:hypothetical protein
LSLAGSPVPDEGCTRAFVGLAIPCEFDFSLVVTKWEAKPLRQQLGGFEARTDICPRDEPAGGEYPSLPPTNMKGVQ